MDPKACEVREFHTLSEPPKCCFRSAFRTWPREKAYSSGTWQPATFWEGDMSSHLARRDFLLGAGTALSALAVGHAARAQSTVGQGIYPAKPVRLVVAFGAGGATDSY